MENLTIIYGLLVEAGAVIIFAVMHRAGIFGTYKGGSSWRS